jgi:hypothetical protein
MPANLDKTLRAALHALEAERADRPPDRSAQGRPGNHGARQRIPNREPSQGHDSSCSRYAEKAPTNEPRRAARREPAHEGVLGEAPRHGRKGEERAGCLGSGRREPIVGPERLDVLHLHFNGPGSDPYRIKLCCPLLGSLSHRTSSHLHTRISLDLSISRTHNASLILLSWVVVIAACRALGGVIARA